MFVKSAGDMGQARRAAKVSHCEAYSRHLDPTEVSVQRVSSGSLHGMQTDDILQLGQLFVVDEMEDLELLTDLLELRGEHLNLALAVESYIQRVPQGHRRLSTVVRERLGRSVKALRCDSGCATFAQATV